MEKIFNAFLLLLIIFCCVQGAFADCFTGFACSIADLEKNQESLPHSTAGSPPASKHSSFQNVTQNTKFIQDINAYFDRKINEDLFFNKNNTNLSYNDIFIFNTIV